MTHPAPQSPKTEQATHVPDYCYDANDWECTYPWSVRDEVLEGHQCSTIVKVNTLISGPTKWAAYIVTERDDEGDELSGEWQWFDSEEAARAAQIRLKAESRT